MNRYSYGSFDCTLVCQVSQVQSRQVINTDDRFFKYLFHILSRNLQCGAQGTCPARPTLALAFYVYVYIRYVSIFCVDSRKASEHQPRATVHQQQALSSVGRRYRCFDTISILKYSEYRLQKYRLIRHIYEHGQNVLQYYRIFHVFIEASVSMTYRL